MNNLNCLYSAYLLDPGEHESNLFTAITNHANRILHTEDETQTFVFGVWQALPNLKIVINFQSWLNIRLRMHKLDANKAATRKERGKELSIANIAPHTSFSDDEKLSHLAQQTLDYYPELADARVSEITDPVLRKVGYLSAAGYTQQEIANKLGVKTSTLKMRMKRYRDNIFANNLQTM